MGGGSDAAFFHDRLQPIFRSAIMPAPTGNPIMMIIHDWLDDRIEERRFRFAPAADPEEFAMLAGVLRSEALACGYRIEALEKACGGDIAAYLMTKQQPLVIDSFQSTGSASVQTV
jgi:hypothetical protein